MTQPHRLQLGTSRLEMLPPAAQAVFVDPSWIHLGDAPPPFLRLALQVLLRKRPSFRKMRQLYRRTAFLEFWFRPGEKLPFLAESFTFIYSEHFFEHLSPSLAAELFRECNRVLKKGGVLRTVVPDAVLRCYEPPEPDPYPAGSDPDGPFRHRSRWTHTNLGSALEQSGFRAIPLDYCTEAGEHIERLPAAIPDAYGPCLDWPPVCDLSYVTRRPSLMVDAVKIADLPRS
jgi:predicted SAM-dependent methyltransferase